MSTRKPTHGDQASRPERPARAPQFSADQHDPPFWQSGLMFGDKINRLCALAPDKAQAIHVLVDLALRETWWQTARTSDGLATLLALTRDSEAP